MKRRALLLALAASLACSGTARAQTAGGIQIMPVMVTIAPRHNIASLRLHNGRARAVSFEVDAYAWSQQNGQDLLAPTQELVVSPAVFEIGAGAEQVVRLGVAAPPADVERAYRIVLRELPSQLPAGNVLGFTLEMSLPVFAPPAGGRPELDVRLADTAQLVLRNTGAAHTQIAALVDENAGALRAPRYLLAGASATIAAPPSINVLHLSATDANGALVDRVIHVVRQNSDHSG